MNILFTSDFSGLGGGETSLINLCDYLQLHNNIIVICCTAGKLTESLKKNNIKTYIIDYRNKSMLFANLMKIRRILITKDIEIIHNNDPLTSVIFHMAAFGLNIKNYWTCHGQWYQFNYIKKTLIKLSNRHVFCVSQNVLDSLDHMGFKHTSVTYLGIPVKKYVEASPSNLREEYNIPKSSTLLAGIGRFQKIKGQLKLVKAIELLLNDKLDIVCLLVGGCIYGDVQEQDYYNETKKYVISHGLENNILFLGERNDVPNIMHEIDLLVIPSDNESFGMVAIESLASGTPVLSTPNDGVSEILEYDDKVLSLSNDEFGLYNVIKNYLTNEKITMFSREFVQKKAINYDIATVSEKYLKVFKEG